MEFRTSKYENTLLGALAAANNGEDDEIGENIVIVDCDCNVSNDDTTPAMLTEDFDYVRIKGVYGDRYRLNNYNLTARKNVYLDNFDVDYSTYNASNKFINIAPEAVDSESDSDATFDFFINNSYVRNAGSLVGYTAPTVSDDEKVLPLKNVVVKNCTFEDCSSTLVDLPCECENVEITHNKYTSETESVHNFALLGGENLKCKDVEIAFNEMYSAERGTLPNNLPTAESHFCKVYGNKVSVHDNIYNGFTVKNKESTQEDTQENTSCNCEPIYIIGSSDTKVYRNKLENFSVGKGAITLEGVFDKINVSENKIDPGDDTNQGSGRVHYLIHFKSLGGVGVFDGTTKLKIASNDLTYHRNSTFFSQELVSAIYFSGTETELNNNKFDILIVNNDYSGTNHFVRYMQKTSVFNIDILYNYISGYGYLDGSKTPMVDLFVAGYKNFEMCPVVNIKGNRGNVGTVFASDYASSISCSGIDRTVVNITRNNMAVRRIILSAATVGIVNGIESSKKKMDVFVSDNNFFVVNSSNTNYINTVSTNPIFSDDANYVFCNNKVYYDINDDKMEPSWLFRGSNGARKRIKCSSFSAIGNEFCAYDNSYSNEIFVNAPTDTGALEKYFIEGYFESILDSGNTFTLLSTETTSQSE